MTNPQVTVIKPGGAILQFLPPLPDAKTRDLGWTTRQRRDVCDEIAARTGLTGAKAKALEGEADSYLRTRLEIVRTLDRRSGGETAATTPKS